MTTERVETWASDDGHELHLVHTLPATEARAHVLIVHGLAEHGGRCAKLVDTLTRNGLGTLTVDLRGHGRSPGARGLVSDAERHVRDVTSLLERLQAGSGPVALYGHSFGGALAARAAQERPDLLDALVLSSPYLVDGGDDPGWVWRAAVASSFILPRLRTRRIPPEAISSRPEERTRYREDPLVDHGGVRLATARELRALGRAVLEDAERLVMPTLVLHGARDRVADVAGSRALAAGAVTEDVTLRVYDEGLHELIHDAGAERVLSGISDWLLDRLGLIETPAG